MTNIPVHVNGKDNLTARWLLGVLIIVLFAAGGYFVNANDKKIENNKAHIETLEKELDGTKDKMNVLYGKIIQFEVKLDEANRKLDSLLLRRPSRDRAATTDW